MLFLLVSLIKEVNVMIDDLIAISMESSADVRSLMFYSRGK